MTRDELIEAAISAFRELAPDGSVRFDPAWLDLDAAGRRRAFEALSRARALEAALDPDGLSTTAHAVLQRIGPGGR
jgi:hypothetical protein